MKKTLVVLLAVAFLASPGSATDDEAHPALPNRPSPDAVAGSKPEEGPSDIHTHSAKKKAKKAKKAAKPQAPKSDSSMAPPPTK